MRKERKSDPSLGAIGVIETCHIQGLLIISPTKHSDGRGFFCETYNKKALEAAGFERTFVQDNQSLSHQAAVLRGLHFQKPPHAQDKLVRVLRGAIFDVAVDLRRGSPTYGQHFSIELSADNWKQLLVPTGFAHGFCTLEPDTEVAYKVSDYYAPDHESGLRWDDPDLAIEWPLAGARILSNRDRHLALFKEFDSPFEWT